MKRVVLWLAMLLLACGIVSAFAEHPGTEVTVTLRLTENSSNAVSARVGFAFNEDVFEFVSAENISADVLNSAPTQAAGKFGLLNLQGLATGEIGKVTLLIKENAPLGKYAFDPVVDSVYDAEHAEVEITVEAEDITVGHVWDDGDVTVVPNCYAEGVLTYRCYYCDATKDEPIPMTVHEEGDPVVTVYPTCTEDGVKVYPCLNCTDDLRTEAIPQLGHTEGDTVITLEPTCEVDGVQVIQCATCGKTIDSETLPALGHTEGDSVVTLEASCGADGVRETKCAICGETIATEAIPATNDHKWDEGVVSVPPTTATEGEMLYTCQICGHTKTESIPLVTLAITRQPASVTVAAGEKATVSFAAEGEGLIYAWYFKDATASKFSLTKSFTGTTYTVEMTAARSGRQLYCVVTDAYGNTVQTETVTISMEDSAPALAITRQPSDVTVAAGEKATVSFTAEGEGLTYAWYFKDATASKFTLTKSFSGNSYTVEMNAARDGRQLYCVVTDTDGNTVQTNTVTIRMEASAPALAITSQPGSVTVAEGEKAVVTFTAVGEGLTYEWYYKDTNHSKFYLTTAFTSNTYSVAMTAARNGRQLYCVVTDVDGNTVQTNTVTISMKAPEGVKITSQPGSVTVAEGAQATVSFTAEGEGLTYAWYFKDTTHSKFYLTTAFTGNTYSVAMTAARNGRQLYCVVTDADGNTAQTNTVTISMKAAEGVKITSQPGSVCVAEGAKATVSFTAEGEGLTYAWYFKDKNASSFVKTGSFTGNTYTVEMNASRDGRQLYCIVTDADGNSVRTDTVTISMKADEGVKITSQPGNVTVAAGEKAVVSFTAEGEGLTYAWYFKDKNASSFVKTSSFTSSTYTVEMNSSRDGRQLYCIVTDADGNSVQTNTVTISMKAAEGVKITSQPGNVTVAEGASATVSFTAEGEGLTYEWFFKNAGASSFTKTSTFTGNTYRVTMDATRDGRQVYCKVTDADGNSVTTNVVTLSMAK